MKVLHISSGNLYGGVEALLLTIARERSLCPEMEPTFALSFKCRIFEELISACASVVHLGEIQTRFPWQVAMARRRLSAFLATNRVDIVVCHMAWALAIFGPVVRKMKLPLVFWLHDVPNGKHWVERWASRCLPDLTLCNSHFTAASISLLFHRKQCQKGILYSPVSFPAADLGPSERLKIRMELDTPSDACVIIQVSRLEPYKGASLHIDALAKLANVPNWVCWMVGGSQRPSENAYLDELKSQALNAGIHDRVHFLGQRRDVPRLLQAADIFCQPNLRAEPFGIVFVEALYAGLPVISTAIGGALEIIDPSTGLLVTPNSSQHLSLALRNYITTTELRSAVKNTGPARAASLCSPAVALSKLHSLLSREISRFSSRGDLAHAS